MNAKTLPELSEMLANLKALSERCDSEQTEEAGDEYACALDRFLYDPRLAAALAQPRGMAGEVAEALKWCEENIDHSTSEGNGKLTLIFSTLRAFLEGEKG